MPKALDNGEKPQFDVIYTSLYEYACNFAGTYVEDRDVARDIVSGVFLTVWDRLDKIITMKRARGFVFISTRNACLNHLRRVKMLKNHQEALVLRMRQEVGRSWSFRSGGTQMDRRVITAIERLPPRAKQVIQLTNAGLGTSDIALILGLAPQTIRNTRKRAIETLRDFLWPHREKLWIDVALTA